jgi:hypothetical protein
MLGYNCSKGVAKRFARCLPCAAGKPGKCGSGSAAWFCRRRLSVLDTRGTLLADKSQTLLRHGGLKLHGCQVQGLLLAFCSLHGLLLMILQTVNLLQPRG